MKNRSVDRWNVSNRMIIRQVSTNTRVTLQQKYGVKIIIIIIFLHKIQLNVTAIIDSKATEISQIKLNNVLYLLITSF